MTLDGHALSIGVSRYRRAAPLPEVADAQDIAAALADPDLCAYPPGNVVSLLEEAATRGAILAALDDLARRARAASTVFVYFSGHGGRSADDTCYLVPVDGDTTSDDSLARTGIAGPELSARLRAIPAGRVTVVLDCCRASGVAEPRDVGHQPLRRGLPPGSLALLASGRGRAVLAASRSDGQAFCRPGERNGVFTRHLLDGLRGKALSVGGVIRICDLFHYAQEQVVAESPRQRPVFKADLEENYPVALCRGGARAELPLPPARDTFRHDAFVSYRHDHAGDRAWTTQVLVPHLERRGLRVCLEHRDFRLGAPRLREMERAVVESRYTVAVFTPDYLDGPFQEFEALVALYHATETRTPRFIPLIRRPCRLSLGQRMTGLLDVSDDAGVDAGIERLARALREPPHPRLSE